MGRRWDRRRFLQAAGIGMGAAALSPFLPRPLAGAQGGPKRLVLITHGNGTDLPGWRPRRHGNDFEFGRVLEPFAAYKDRMLVLDGIDNTAIAGSERRGSGHDGMSTLWTGLELPAGDFGDKHVGWPTGPSIDHLVAEHYAGQTRLGAIYLGTRGAGVGSEGPIRVAHHRGLDQPIQTQNNPLSAFETIFDGVSADVAALEREASRRRSILDFVRGDLRRVQGNLPSVDRDRMERHLAGVRQLEERLHGMSVSCTTPDAPRDYSYSELQESTLLSELSELQMSLMVNAFRCDLARVACFQWGGEGSTGTGYCLRGTEYPTFGGIHTTSHEMTYGADLTAVDRQAARDNIANLNRWRSQMLVDHLIRPLDESGLLDDTLFVWGSAMCEGGNHSNRNVPIVILQGSNLRHFRTNYAARWGDFDPATATNGYNRYHGGLPMNRVLLSIGHAMGLDHLTHIGEPDIDSSPIDEVLL